MFCGGKSVGHGQESFVAGVSGQFRPMFALLRNFVFGGQSGTFSVVGGVFQSFDGSVSVSVRVRTSRESRARQSLPKRPSVRDVGIYERYADVSSGRRRRSDVVVSSRARIVRRVEIIFALIRVEHGLGDNHVQEIQIGGFLGHAFEQGQTLLQVPSKFHVVDVGFGRSSSDEHFGGVFCRASSQVLLAEVADDL